jgi:drug/metabolite transporter (DMT)-like permease
VTERRQYKIKQAKIKQAKIKAEWEWRTLLAVTITILAWASAFVVIRYAAHDIRPGALSLGRLLVASVALSAMMIGRKLVRMTGREWALTAVVGRRLVRGLQRCPECR